jgi:hypothetical protein
MASSSARTNIYARTYMYTPTRIHTHPKQLSHILILSPDPTCKRMHTLSLCSMLSKQKANQQCGNVEIQDQKTHVCPCGPMHAHDEPTTACQTVRAQHSRPQHLARTSLPSCSTFSRCPHTKRCTQLVASPATLHLRARRTQSNWHPFMQ